MMGEPLLIENIARFTLVHGQIQCHGRGGQIDGEVCLVVSVYRIYLLARGSWELSWPGDQTNGCWGI